jgi:hypothetical protein
MTVAVQMQLFNRMRTAHILSKYNLLLETFLNDSEKLFRAEGMDPQETAAATRDIRQMLDLLKEGESE